MKIIKPHSVLAVGAGGTTGQTGINSFLVSPIGIAVIGICGVVGVLIVVTCIFKMVKSVTSGRPGEGFKVLIFGLVIGGLLFNLNVTVTAISSMSDLIKNVFDSTSQITGNKHG
jgi:hypothetical protein